MACHRLVPQARFINLQALSHNCTLIPSSTSVSQPISSEAPDWLTLHERQLPGMALTSVDKELHGIELHGIEYTYQVL